MKTDLLNKNNLRKYRKRAGLEQKQVAFPLNRSSPDEISRYERGLHRPNLETAMKLAVIYRVPIRLIYYKLFEHCRSEINERKRLNPQLLPDPNWTLESRKQLKNEELCFYGDLLKNHIPNALELETANKHTVNLINTISFYRQGLNPYPKDN